VEQKGLEETFGVNQWVLFDSLILFTWIKLRAADKAEL